MSSVFHPDLLYVLAQSFNHFSNPLDHVQLLLLSVRLGGCFLFLVYTYIQDSCFVSVLFDKKLSQGGSEKSSGRPNSAENVSYLVVNGGSPFN